MKDSSQYIETTEYGSRAMVSKRLLGNLDIELTERCNNNCLHCYINLPGDHEAKDRELTTDQIRTILLEAVSLGCERIRLTGGEPLLREDFPEIYTFARRLGLIVMVFTNATLVTPEIADLFARIPPLENIEVSVYGMNRTSYESCSRVPGSYNAFRRGIGLLLDRKVPFIVKGVFLSFNEQEIEEFQAWARTLPGMRTRPSYSMNLDLRVRGDSEKRNDIIRSIRPDPEDKMRDIETRKEEYIREMKDFIPRFTSPPGDKLFTCGAGLRQGCVDAYGIFQACMLLRHPDTLYDLKNGSLRDALTGFFPEVRKTRATNPEYLERCARCFLKGLCDQCPAKSWMEYGTLDTPVNESCEFTHAQARLLGLLDEGEKSWEVKNWEERVRGLK